MEVAATVMATTERTPKQDEGWEVVFLAPLALEAKYYHQGDYCNRVQACVNEIKAYLKMLLEMEKNINDHGYGPRIKDEAGPYDWHNEDMGSFSIEL